MDPMDCFYCSHATVKDCKACKGEGKLTRDQAWDYSRSYDRVKEKYAALTKRDRDDLLRLEVRLGSMDMLRHAAEEYAEGYFLGGDELHASEAFGNEVKAAVDRYFARLKEIRKPDPR